MQWMRKVSQEGGGNQGLRDCYRVQMASTTCSRHSDQTVAFQCGRCKVLVCSKCVTGDHQGHPMIELSKIYKDEKAKVEKDIREIEQKSIPNSMKAIKEIQTKTVEYKKAITDIRKEMDDEIKELKARLDGIHADRLKNLADAEAVGLKQFDLVLRDLEERKRSYTEDVAACKAKITSNNQVQFVSYARTRGTKRHKCPVLKFSSPQIQVQMVKSKNREIYDLLAKLTISTAPLCTITYKQIVDPKIVSTFQSTLKGCPCICLTYNGKAWVGRHESKELRLVDNTGKVLQKRQMKYRATALAMALSGDIILSPNPSDSKPLMKLRADGTECPLLDVSPSSTTGVSVTENGDILVCVSGGRVMRCDRDGLDVQTLYDGKKAKAAI